MSKETKANILTDEEVANAAGGTNSGKCPNGYDKEGFPHNKCNKRDCSRYYELPRPVCDYFNINKR